MRNNCLPVLPQNSAKGALYGAARVLAPQKSLDHQTINPFEVEQND